MKPKSTRRWKRIFGIDESLALGDQGKNIQTFHQSQSSESAIKWASPVLRTASGPAPKKKGGETLWPPQPAVEQTEAADSGNRISKRRGRRETQRNAEKTLRFENVKTKLQAARKFFSAHLCVSLRLCVKI